MPSILHKAHILPRKVCALSLSFFLPKLYKCLKAVSISVSIWPRKNVLVWGHKPVARRGEWLAKKTKARLWRVEDAFIRSIHPGWEAPPAGLVFDEDRAYFNAELPPHFKALLEDGERQYSNIEVQERIKRQIGSGISKYNQTPRGLWQKKGYILLIDQVRGDASIALGGASETSFQEMLITAKKDHPKKEILIRSHPAGNGHFQKPNGVTISSEDANPWDVLEGAEEVYVVTSLMGFEAILAGHRPHVFGRPFYAGWGLSHDHQAINRKRSLSLEDLYEFTMMRYPSWFNAAGEIADIDEMLDGMEAVLRHHHRFRKGVRLENISAWKRPHMKLYFPNQVQDGERLSWGEGEGVSIIEDGFIRSRGLGADLVPPMSLVTDKIGIYYDPRSQSELEELILARSELTPYMRARARKLQSEITKLGISKYNLDAVPLPQIPKDKTIILVVGQVADDRSIRFGATGPVQTSQELLSATRARHPQAFLIYKPHPDVLAGLRQGQTVIEGADLVYEGGSLEPLWPHVSIVSTITSLVGFEALLRGKKVETYGMPFYADWGLTTDFAKSTGRRGHAEIESLIYATLIDYPTYLDPLTKKVSTPEIIIKRLASGRDYIPPTLRLKSRLQRALYKITARNQNP